MQRPDGRECLANEECKYCVTRFKSLRLCTALKRRRRRTNKEYGQKVRVALWPMRRRRRERG